MARQLFVNLPVSDLDRSVDFFTKLGFTFNPQFTDETATCMIVNDSAFVMLLTEPTYAQFTDKAIADAAAQSEAILTFSADSREDVDKLVHAALANGGKPAKDVLEEGPMYGWSFYDPDNHHWEVMYMDMSAMEG